MSDLQAILAEVHAQRARTRSPFVTAAILVGGFAAALLGAVLAIPLPEAGVPLLLLGLRLLALRLEWAATAYAHVKWRWNRVKAWWRAKPRWVREGMLWGIAVAFLIILKLLW